MDYTKTLQDASKSLEEAVTKIKHVSSRTTFFPLCSQAEKIAVELQNIIDNSLANAIFEAMRAEELRFQPKEEKRFKG